MLFGSLDKISSIGNRSASPAAKGAGGTPGEGGAAAAGARTDGGAGADGAAGAAAGAAAGGELAGLENNLLRAPNMDRAGPILPESGPVRR